MKATTYFSGFLTRVARFWDDFLDGFCEEERRYNLPSSLSHSKKGLSRKNRVKDIRGQPKRKATDSVQPAFPEIPKTHRPDMIYHYQVTLTVDVIFPEFHDRKIRFDLRMIPYMDRTLDERMYSYNFFAGERSFRFCLGNGDDLFLFENQPLPRSGFIFSSVTETVEYKKKESAFVINYTIRDSKRKKRRFRASRPGQEGVLEALKFFFSLQYYETWEEYDEMKDICPLLCEKAQTIRDEVRRELNEVGVRVVG